MNTVFLTIGALIYLTSIPGAYAREGSLPVCRYLGYNQNRCSKQHISCQFSPDELRALERYENHQAPDFYENARNHIRKVKDSRNETHQDYYVSTTFREPRKELISRNFVTCSALVVYASQCNHANLTHLFRNNPATMATTLKADLSAKCTSAELADSEIFLMYSVPKERIDSRADLELNGIYTRRLLCRLAEQYPGGRFTVFESRKDSFEEDEIRVDFENRFASVTLKRKSTRPGHTQQPIQSWHLPLHPDAKSSPVRSEEPSGVR
jgi:hypothetical protein